MIKLSGILEYSMGNFLCLRGFASYKMLSAISQPNPNVQRDLIEKHKGEMAEYLNHGEYRFFPEVILSLNLTDGESGFDLMKEMHEDLQEGKTWNRSIKGFNFDVSQNKTKNVLNQFSQTPKVDRINIAHIRFDETKTVITRIDGNHRLSAAEEVQQDFDIPFCLLLFQNPKENDQFSRAIFHIINAKQIPLVLEENLRVILTSTEVFSDSKLKSDPSFGWNYYLARKIVPEIEYSYFPMIYSFIGKTPYCFFVELYDYLIKNKKVEENEEAIAKVKSELTNIEQALVESKIAGTTSNISVIGALAYYKITNLSKYRGFLTWVKKNNIGSIDTLHISDVINLYDEIYEHVPKKIFLARWYPSAKDGDDAIAKAEARLYAMRKIADDMNLELIDLGTSDTGAFDIHDAIKTEIKDCDIFIADLTGARPNVMIEVGYALKHINTGRMVFYFQKSEKGDAVPFDVNNLQYDEISDSRDIIKKTQKRIETILQQAKDGEI